ncbi:MAG TPA: hypothetical protein VL137_01115, partial [Polyangiaceae bacterium]|nr:hypothetical protein [Polyangiaceae bacterium]
MKIQHRIVSAAALWLSLGALSACTRTPTPPPLRSLRGMTDSSLLCLASLDSQADDPAAERFARPIDACPDYDSTDGESRSLHALVTQPETGEVALVDVQRGAVVDAERTLPGLSFLPVGGNPVSVVSTPGGSASFVATREAGKPGIYALPTSCVGTRRDDQPFVDVTSWAACRLPAEPGAMQILIDPLLRTSCADPINSAVDSSATSPSAQRVDCPANLAEEEGPLGQRKLLVALPT